MEQKASGSFRMAKDVKNGVEALAKKENRSFNNMLEEIAKRHIENEKTAVKQK